MPKASPFLEAAKAEDLHDLLNHIAWTDVVRPALLREREVFTKLLVASTLGAPVQVPSSSGPVPVTREQLAGKIYGIDYITGLMEKILDKGVRAVEELNRAGVHIAKSYGDSSDSFNT